MRIELLIVLLVFAPAGVRGADWTGFRGPETTSVALRSTLPTTLTEQSVVWKSALPGRGLSGPTIVGDRIYLTACTGEEQDRLHVLCLDARDGKLLWQRQTWATGRTMCHKSMSVATPQIASDGQRIFAFFSSNDLACYDQDGRLQWFRGLTHDYPNASNSLGMASSPLVVGKILIVQVESDSESFTVGLDVETGINRWKIPRPQVSNWTSPVLYRGSQPGSDLVLLQSSEDLVAIEPATGKIAWKFGGGCSTIPTATVDAGTIFIPSNGLTAYRPGRAGDKGTTLWSSAKLGPATASPVVAQNRIFVLGKTGILTCGRADSGATLWQSRLEGRISSTPVFAGEHLYVFNENGTLFVVHPNDQEGKVVSRFELKEPILATPAVANNALYIRSDAHLWKFAATR